MFCKNCGKSIDDDAVICPNCGVQVGEFKTAETAKPEENTNSKSSNVVGLVGFILAMVGVLLWGIGIVVSALMIMSIPVSIAAIVCSALGVKGAKDGKKVFHGLSIAGLVVSIVTVSITLLFFILGLALLSSLL